MCEGAVGINMTAAGSGSNGIVVANNAAINAGASDFALIVKTKLSDWTPSAAQMLMMKYASTKGFQFYVASPNGVLGIYDGVNAIEYKSTAVPAIIDGSFHDMACIRRGTNIEFYVDYAKLGNTVSASAWNMTYTSSLYILGTSTARVAGTIAKVYILNFAPTADEMLAMKTTIPDSWKYATQTAITSGTLTVGKQYQIDTYNADDDFANVGASSNAAGVRFVATGDTPTHWAHSSSLRLAGITLALEPSGIQSDKWYDSSTNDLDASYPATGWSLIWSYTGFNVILGLPY